MNEVLCRQSFPNGQVFALVRGDITAESVDAIVNAANSQLRHGAGVAGAIVRRGGMQIQQESRAWVRQYGPVSHAEPAYTHAGRLRCSYVIHAVGPVWGEGDEDIKLDAAVNGSLRRASELGLHSLSMPAISTGIFGFPLERAARIIFQSIRRYFEDHPETDLHLVRLVTFDRRTVQVFLSVWDDLHGSAS